MQKKKWLGVMAVAAFVVTAVIVTIFIINNRMIPEMKYERARELLEAGDYEGAALAFEELGDYKAAKEYIQGIEGQRKEQALAEKYKEAEKLLADGKKAEAAMTFVAADYYADARERSMALWDGIAKRETITGGMTHTTGLKTDGTVVTVGLDGGRRKETDDWTDIIAVASNWKYTIGLKADGTVVAAGERYDKAIEDDWKDIVSIATSTSTSFYPAAAGLKTDGTVVAVGLEEDWGYGVYGYDVSDWTDIIAIAAGGSHVVGLKADGTVVAEGSNRSGQCDVRYWKDIVAISASDSHTVGLKADGTVVSTASYLVGWGWEDIVDISAGNRYTIGLKADGTVVAAGENKNGRCDVSEWTDIVAISAVFNHAVGLKADGTVVAAGENSNGQCDVSELSDVKLPQ